MHRMVRHRRSPRVLRTATDGAGDTDNMGRL